MRLKSLPIHTAGLTQLAFCYSGGSESESREQENKSDKCVLNLLFVLATEKEGEYQMHMFSKCECL